MRIILTCAAALSMAALAWSVQPVTPASAKKAPSKKAVAKKAPAKSAQATSAVRKPSTKTGSGATVRTVSARKSGRKTSTKRITWRNRQSAPTPDRYREIQSALVAKGYLAPDAATGTWDQTSAEALKKFQAEQNLDSTGKINSLSLIALGLGPRHDSAKPAEGVNNN